MGENLKKVWKPTIFFFFFLPATVTLHCCVCVNTPQTHFNLNLMPLKTSEWLRERFVVRARLADFNHEVCSAAKCFSKHSESASHPQPTRPTCVVRTLWLTCGLWQLCDVFRLAFKNTPCFSTDVRQRFRPSPRLYGTLIWPTYGTERWQVVQTASVCPAWATLAKCLIRVSNTWPNMVQFSSHGQRVQGIWPTFANFRGGHSRLAVRAAPFPV